VQAQDNALQEIKDRLLVVETKLEYLATKAELVQGLADLRDSLRTFMFQLFGGVVIVILIATVVNHFWR
jgi:hypothetical protein